MTVAVHLDPAYGWRTAGRGGVTWHAVGDDAVVERISAGTASCGQAELRTPPGPLRRRSRRQAAALRRAGSTSTRLSWNTAPPAMSESRSATVRLRFAFSPTIFGQ